MAEGMRGSTLMLAFNKPIATELQEKLKLRGIDWKRVRASTVHSAGLGAYRKTFPKSEFNEHKVADICAQAILMQKIPADIAPYSSTVCKLVSLAKQVGIGIREIAPIGDDTVWMEVIEHFDLLEDDNAEKKVGGIIAGAQLVLAKSNDMTDWFDYDDMVYMPLVHAVKFWQYDNVIVDEAQDTNAVRRLLVKALLRRNGRLIAVGDRNQAIYAFSGADSNSLDLIKNAFGCIELPLTVTYRCPKAVVTFAHKWVHHIQAHETAPEGKVSYSSFEDFIKRKDLDGNCAVICRNTKPLVSAAFAMIREKIPCRIEGREIGTGLTKLATRWSSIKTINALREKLEEWREREVKKAEKKRKDARVQQVNDQAETLGVIMDACKEKSQHHITDVVDYIDNIFADQVSGILTLSTIHKSKGREWQKVFWLDRVNTCPSSYARQEWERQAEKNLCYVAATRAKNELIELAMPRASKEKTADKAANTSEKQLTAA